jgi:hypothetical protein
MAQLPPAIAQPSPSHIDRRAESYPTPVQITQQHAELL